MSKRKKYQNLQNLQNDFHLGKLEYFDEILLKLGFTKTAKQLFEEMNTVHPHLNNITKEKK